LLFAVKPESARLRPAAGRMGRQRGGYFDSSVGRRVPRDGHRATRSRGRRAREGLVRRLPPLRHAAPVDRVADGKRPLGRTWRAPRQAAGVPTSTTNLTDVGVLDVRRSATPSFGTIRRIAEAAIALEPCGAGADGRRLRTGRQPAASRRAGGDLTVGVTGQSVFDVGVRRIAGSARNARPRLERRDDSRPEFGVRVDGFRRAGPLPTVDPARRPPRRTRRPVIHLSVRLRAMDPPGAGRPLLRRRSAARRRSTS
jgi:hypothetical protein